MSTVTADQVVADTVQAAQAEFGPEIEAMYTLGSLAHGGFAPLVSDVDVAIVLRSTSAETGERVTRVQSLVRERASSPLSDRLSIFWGDWEAVRPGRSDHFRLGPVDRLDLLESGRLLLGSDRREPSVRPSRRDLVLMSADLMLTKFTESYLQGLSDSAGLLAGGVRAVTKAVLFPVRFMYTLGTGAIGLNEASAHWYAGEGLPGSALALRALQWRHEGLGELEPAAALLEAELATLHAVSLTEYANDLDGLGESSRVAALTDRARLLDVAVPNGS
jgi:predicted nucleotidyltransferase